MCKGSIYRIAMVIAGIWMLAITAPVHASHPEGTLNAEYDGVAIKGYDPVAYFVSGHAKKGSEEFSYEWLGTKWLFASAENRQLFAADPIKYAPQYGGYCSTVHLVEPGKADINPTAWRIVNGQLYLFYEEGEAIEQYGERVHGDANELTWDQMKQGLSQ